MRRALVLLKNVVSLPLRLGTGVSALAILQQAKVHQTAAVCSGVRLYRSELRRYSYIGRGSFVCDADIGGFCSISEACCIGAAAHPLSDVSMSPVFHRRDNILKTSFDATDFNPYSRTRIGNDVLIGYGAMLRAGVHIGDGAAIGMGSVVTKDVGPYEVWAGNPARRIRPRFEADEVDQLMRIRWWEWPDELIRARAKDFHDVRRFVERYGL
ncbi:MAG: CatB-related O-acetyltransferase [Clostridia bacterium]|nr:CatB-related O-acetyltransferase [Clostridia bacterium]